MALNLNNPDWMSDIIKKLTDYNVESNNSSVNTDVNLNSQQTPVETPNAAPTNNLINRALGRTVSPNKTTYANYSNLINNIAADGEITRSERKNLRNLLGVSRRRARQIVKDIEGRGDGVALNNTLKNLERNYYIKDGKLYTEGEDGFDPVYYNSGQAKYYGTNLEDVVNAYNKDIIDWRNNTIKNSSVTFDPTTGKYWAKGADGGKDVDVTDSTWLTDDHRTTFRNNWFTANKDKLGYDADTQQYTYNGSSVKDASYIDSTLGTEIQLNDFYNKIMDYIKTNNGNAKNTSNVDIRFAGAKAPKDLHTAIGLTEEDAKNENYNNIYTLKLGQYLTKLANDPSIGEIGANAVLYNLMQKNLTGTDGINNADAYLDGKLARVLNARNKITSKYSSLKQGGNLNNIKNIKQSIKSHKTGGKMNKINYFLAGGAAAPAAQASPAQGGQDIQAQVVQLVQAAMSGDQQATDTINKIMQAAQQGDLQATQLAQMIQEVAKQMQGQATAAKYGAKLAYIRSLKEGCPAGYTVQYNKKGGHLCKECVKAVADSFQKGGAPKKPVNKMDQASRDSIAANKYNDQEVQNNVTGKTPGSYKKNAQGKVQWTPDRTKAPYNKASKNACGGAMKPKKECGGAMKSKKACGGMTIKPKVKCGGKAMKKKCEVGGQITYFRD